jgi:hypothetical protein
MQKYHIHAFQAHLSGLQPISSCAMNRIGIHLLVYLKATSDIHLVHVKIYLCISGVVDRDGSYIHF